MTAVIAGVGMTRPTPHQDVLVGAELAASAFIEALDDAGFQRGQVDGLVVQHGQTGGPDYDEFAQFMNIEPEFCYQMWAHGRLTGSAIKLGAMMIDSGSVEVVACVTGYRSEYARIGGVGGPGFNEEIRTRNGGGPHGEQPHVGVTAPRGPSPTSWRRCGALTARRCQRRARASSWRARISWPAAASGASGTAGFRPAGTSSSGPGRAWACGCNPGHRTWTSMIACSPVQACAGRRLTCSTPTTRSARWCGSPSNGTATAGRDRRPTSSPTRASTWRAGCRRTPAAACSARPAGPAGGTLSRPSGSCGGRPVIVR